ncbi:MAG TPA: hypothetical protein VLF39_04680 [Candidatus Saccharimonadales bacterium]|nr:hypothetical protein [Candidatus Saccharimonadales bacterium]
MNLIIDILEKIRTNDRFGSPNKARKQTKPLDLAVNVPDNLNMIDRMGTYKPWFNGMKHFYTVKPLPPPPKK